MNRRFKLRRWISVDPPLIRGAYLPQSKGFKMDVDSIWSEESKKQVQELPGIGEVLNR